MVHAHRAVHVKTKFSIITCRDNPVARGKERSRAKAIFRSPPRLDTVSDTRNAEISNNRLPKILNVRSSGCAANIAHHIPCNDAYRGGYSPILTHRKSGKRVSHPSVWIWDLISSAAPTCPSSSPSRFSAVLGFNCHTSLRLMRHACSSFVVAITTALFPLRFVCCD